MDRIIIKGQNRLRGNVKISGSKNAGLAIMAATLLAKGEYKIKNVPDLSDIKTMVKLLQKLGSEIYFRNNELNINTNGVVCYEAPYDLVKTMRASIYVLGPLIARRGRAKVSFPGGCALGARPINFHLTGLQKLGVSINIKHGYIHAQVGNVKGTEIYLERKSVGATANLLMASVLANGTTIIKNSACEPEIVSLACFLNSMGANISGIGTDSLIIKGVKNLHPTNTTLIPDRIEAGTFLASAAITNGTITVQNCNPNHLGIVLDKFRECGFTIQTTNNTISLISKVKKYPLEITTNPYPGFPTDLQPQFTALLTTIKGKSIINETIFSDRFMFITELERLGANIKLDGREIIINGGTNLTSAPLMASDIRAGASIVIAALAAKGKSTVSRVYHIDRGYENFEKKLEKLGANIKRVS